jgi:hypothetical protein
MFSKDSDAVIVEPLVSVPIAPPLGPDDPAGIAARHQSRHRRPYLGRRQRRPPAGLARRQA